MVDSPPATDEVPSPLNSAGIINTLNETADSGDLGKIMEALLRHQPREGLAESVLYSDIHQAEKIVRVYGSGPFFRDLGYGETFSFEGTIAENIIRFNLQKIIVEDTMKSIKPIDWALFIPHGVRSYYAQPFFDNDKLHTVLIFCSGKPGAFTEENVTPYHELFPFFLRGLEACRSRKSYQKT
jgi:hypothetical protein